jgi:hypothetical protein
MEKLSDSLNKLYVGFIAGLIGPWFGVLIFYAIFFNHKSIRAFALTILNNGSTHSGIIAVSLIFNLVFFYFAIRKEWYRAAQGVIMAVFCYAPFVVYFKYVG